MARRDGAQYRTAEGEDRAGRTREGTRRKKSTSVHATRGKHLRPASRFINSQRLFTKMKGIADTGFLVAAVSRSDQYYFWAASLVDRINEPLLTCEAVLAETAFHLRSSSAALRLLRDGLVRVAFDATEELDALAELAERYADRNPDLADLCLIRLSELHPSYPVITTDVSDFRVYRRYQRELIPLIHPPSHRRRRGRHI